jgi:protein-tyrosine phosphatase
VEQSVEKAERQRWVHLDGAFNFRDLGGYSAGDGITVWGSVFRSDALHHLSAEDVQRLTTLGIDRVIDLRSPEEIAAVGRGCLDDAGIECVWAPILQSTSGEAQGAPTSPDLAERYLWYLDVGRGAFVDAFEVLADSGRGAVAFHCTAGKDRTGVLAALLLASLGVGGDDIASDYALTSQALPSIIERLSRDPIHGASVAQAPPDRRVVSAGTMHRFLQLLSDRHGGASQWMETAGVSPASIDALRRKLWASS